MNEVVKQAFKDSEEKYLEYTKDYKDKKISFVPWNIYKTARLYLFNKGIDCKSQEVLAEEHYQIVIINGYKDGKYLGTMVLLPEDTESKAYGKADKCILEKLKEVK